MSNELKPCPFCGSTSLLTEPYFMDSYVHCQGCGADGPEPSHSECEELWNNRIEQQKIKLTKTPPTEEGLYYYNSATHFDISVKTISFNHGELIVEEWGTPVKDEGDDGYWAKVDKSQFAFESGSDE